MEGHDSKPRGRAASAGVRATDCLSCRVTGTVTCLGLGAYLAAQQYARPATSVIQGRLMYGAAVGLGIMAVARAVL